MIQSSCNGVRINCRQAGEGEDLVLIHGLATHHAFWHLNIMLPLARERRITVYDLRGHGYSEMPKTGYSPAHMLDDLLHLLDNLQIERADLVGHSYGGVVGLCLAAFHPDRVRTLTVADSRIRAVQPTNYARDWPLAEIALPKLREVGLDVPDDEADSGMWLLEQLASPRWLEARDTFKGSSLFVPFSGWNGGQRTAERWLELLNTTTARRDIASDGMLDLQALQHLRCPVLAMYGERSSLLPSMRGLEQTLPNCRSVRVPQAGHFHPTSKPDYFVETLLGFLRET